jgi:hypothetical protein
MCGGYFSPTTTAHKIIRVGFYWTLVFKASYSSIMRCVSCQKNLGRMKKSVMSLHPISVEKPFTQWGLDVIRPINLNSRKGHIYILTTTDYLQSGQNQLH